MAIWKPGQSGNPKGRPKGSRDAITKAFVDDLTKDWREHGAEALEQARKERPAEYVRMVANLLPKEATVQLNMQSQVGQARLEAMRAMSARLKAPDANQIDHKPKIIDGEAREIEKTPALPKPQDDA